MALADLTDVYRILRLTAPTADQTSQLAGALEAAESRGQRYLRQDYSATDAGTAKYYDVHEDAALSLPVENATVQAVRAFPGVAWTQSTWIMQVDADYDVENGKTVRLRPNPFTRPFEGAVAGRVLVTYQRVEVDYTPIGDVPAGVRDGIALLAAILWKREYPAIDGLTGETIGDYSYQRRPLHPTPGAEEKLPAEVIRMLRPFRKTRPLVT